MAGLIEQRAVVLFQGDSITDCGRDRKNGADMGRGYALMASAWFSALNPEKEVEFINRGISGDTVVDLKARWQSDCIDLKPTWVSVLIGINDTARAFTRDTPTSPEQFESDYRGLLDRVRNECGARIVLIEPFLLPSMPERAAWREDLDRKIESVHRLATDFEALLVPMDQMFRNACTLREARWWSHDGVHPGAAGHALMAQAWLAALKVI
ncbi:MAG: SGNH/GDSL hydrolase family protein [Candidatus Brocadiaceae bacterium]|nr:SGNH/GDSL hydrolase family protein [Candidatus Brocadiaceae bacterium]